MCQFEPAPLPGFITTFAATDVIPLLLLIVFLWMVVNLVNDPRSLGRRWFGRRGAVIVSLVPALCVAFAVSMMELFLIPSSEAIKHWDAIQRTMIMPPCTADDLDAAYASAFDRLGAYYNLLFGLPAVCGAFGLLLLGWRWPIQLRRQVAL